MVIFGHPVFNLFRPLDSVLWTSLVNPQRQRLSVGLPKYLEFSLQVEHLASWAINRNFYQLTKHYLVIDICDDVISDITYKVGIEIYLAPTPPFFQLFHIKSLTLKKPLDTLRVLSVILKLSFFQIPHHLHRDRVHVRAFSRRRRGLQDRKTEPCRSGRIREHRKVGSCGQAGPGGWKHQSGTVNPLSKSQHLGKSRVEWKDIN